ncbi:hypothetical protein BsLM_1467 [Bacillus sp. LM 4-2]|nr:hypothetical protein BsLM_1467 [Bacillus sp. LM 4-2]
MLFLDSQFVYGAGAQLFNHFCYFFGTQQKFPPFLSIDENQYIIFIATGQFIREIKLLIALLLNENTAKYFQKALLCLKERKLVKIAKVGNVIEFKNGLTGVVEKVNENSVIVDVTIMDNYRDLELDSLTVVNHKNYKIIRDSY